MKLVITFLVCIFLCSCSTVKKYPHPDGGTPEYWLAKVQKDLPLGSTKEQANHWFVANNFKSPNYEQGTIYDGELTPLYLSSLIERSVGGWSCVRYSTELVVIFSASRGVIGYDLLGEGLCL